MTRNAPATAPREDLAARNAAHVPRYWMLLDEDHPPLTEEP